MVLLDNPSKYSVMHCTDFMNKNTTIARILSLLHSCTYMGHFQKMSIFQMTKHYLFQLYNFKLHKINKIQKRKYTYEEKIVI